MWEFSLCLESNNYDAARYIYSTLKKSISGMGNLVTSYETDGRIYIVLACEDVDRGRMQFLLSHCISSVICKVFKEEYLNSHLSLPNINDMKLSAFKNALLSFDKETDAFLVSKNLNFDTDLYLESFFMFKLGSLRDKWAELVALANDNRSYLISSDTFMELLRFLIDNLEIREGEINVIEDENGYKILNDTFEELDEDFYPTITDNNEKLVASLIELCPRKINIYCDTNSSAIELLSDIFDKRINVCDKIMKKS